MSAQPAVTPSSYADAALQLAHRIASLAVADADGSPAWSGDDLDPVALAAGDDNPGLAHAPLDEGLLTGRAGIAVALAACARLPGADPRWASLARRAAAAAVRHAAADLPGGRLGWDSGALGIARAAEVVASLIGEPDLRVGAARLAREAVAAVLADPDAVPPWSDLLGGVAGVLVAAACAPLPPDAEPDRTRVLGLLIGRLGAGALKDRAGVRWPMATTDHPVVGLAHGASGIAFALRTAARRLDRGRTPLRLVGGATPTDAADGARRLAEAALRWEEGLWDRALGGWPDLRVASRPPGLAWCHGSPGVGVCAALTAGAEPGTRAAAWAHAAYLRAASASGAHRPSGMAFDGTLCHGLGGIVELHLVAAQAWPDAAPEHLRLARGVASHLVAAGEPGHPTWHCGIPRGGRTPNLVVGLAGVAMTLTRCHAVHLAPSPADPTLGWSRA